MNAKESAVPGRLEPTGPQHQHRQHVEELLQKLKKEHLNWYEMQQTIHYWLWIGLEAVSILAPASATVLATIAMAHGTFDSAATKTWLTTLPVIATVSSSLLSRLGAREMEHAREIGRQEVEYLLERSRVELHTATTDSELIGLRKKLIEEIERIDIDQHRKHHQIAQSSKRTTHD